MPIFNLQQKSLRAAPMLWMLPQGMLSFTRPLATSKTKSWVANCPGIGRAIFTRLQHQDASQRVSESTEPSDSDSQKPSSNSTTPDGVTRNAESHRSAKTHRFSKAEDGRIMDLRRNGHTFTEIGRTLNFSSSSIRARLSYLASTGNSEARLLVTRKSKPVTLAERDLILKLRARGMTLGEIRGQVQQSYSVIQKVIKNPDYCTRIPARRWTAEDEVRVKYYRDDAKLPWNEVARRMGRSPDSCAIRYSEKFSQQTSKTALRFTDEEDNDLMRMREEFRMPWKEIQTYMPHRSMVSLTIRYHHFLKDKDDFNDLVHQRPAADSKAAATEIPESRGPRPGAMEPSQQEIEVPAP